MRGLSVIGRFLLGGTGLALCLPGSAFAQSGDSDAAAGEIVVTAQRREEKQVDVPITVTSLSQDQIVTANVQSLSGIAKITPALRFDNQIAFVQPSIRGVGTAVTSSGVGSNVGIYIDGFYSQNPLAADFDLLNVQSIQVLKGPQGTLFGRNTTGGAILIQSAEPSTETHGVAKASYARFNELKAQGYVTVGLTEGVAWDVEGAYRRGDGFVRELTTRDKVGKHDSWSLRTALKAQLSPDISVLVRYTHNTVDDPSSVLAGVFVDRELGLTASNFAAPGMFTTNKNRFVSDVRPFVHTKADAFQGTVKADLGFANLTSYTQYRTEDTNMQQDLDKSSVPIFAGGFTVKDKTFSQELLMTSKPGPALQWTLGAFYFSNKDIWRFFVDNAYPNRVLATGSGTKTRAAAVYADLTYQVAERLFLTAGARYSHDQIDDAYYMAPYFTGIVVPVTPAQAAAVRKDRLTPRVVLRYKPTSDSSLYLSFNRGYKAGMLDVGGITGNPIKPETINAFEGGYKLDGRTFSFETAAFYYDYKNLQVSLFNGSPPSAKILNAADSEIYGLEAQFRARMNDSFDLNGGANWTHARYKRFDTAPVYAKCAITDVIHCGGGTTFYEVPNTTLRNVHMQHSPAFTGNIGARYHAPLAGGEFALSGNLYYTSSVYMGPSGTQFRQKGYELLSLRAQWTDPGDHFTLAVFGDNLTDRRYLTQVQYNNFAQGSSWSAPATYGVEVSARF